MDFFQRWLRQVFMFFVLVPNHTRWHQQPLLYQFKGSIWKKVIITTVLGFSQKGPNIIDCHLHGLVCLGTKVCRVLTVSLDMETSRSNLLKREVRLRIVHFKLDGVGPVDNRPSTKKLHHFVRKKEKRKKKWFQILRYWAGFFGIGATIHVGWEILCLPYAGFFQQV